MTTKHKLYATIIEIIDGEHEHLFKCIIQAPSEDAVEKYVLSHKEEFLWGDDLADIKNVYTTGTVTPQQLNFLKKKLSILTWSTK